MRAAVLAVRAGAADRIVVAVPVAPRSTLETLGAEVDEVVCLIAPEPFRGVGAWYADFDQVSDEAVGALLG
jgi:predicted phosphoribosyltransferase